MMTTHRAACPASKRLVWFASATAFLTLATSTAHARERAPAPPPPASEAEDFQHIQTRADLDLRDEWEDYVEDRRPEQSFFDFTAHRFVVRRRVGIALTTVGVLSLAAGGTALGLAYSIDYDAFFTTGVVGIGVGLGNLIAGSVLWGRNQRRLNRLRGARLSAVGPQLLRRGAGVSVALAF